MIKKLVVSIFVVLTFVIYSIHQRGEGAAALARVVNSNNGTSSNITSVSPSTTSTAPHSQSSNTPTTGQYKDGTYTGSKSDAFYGYIQVQVTVSGGKMNDVVFLQYPNDQGNSVEINDYAMPILKQQAISAQSSRVDGVSGATDTSQAFVQSLSDALSQAKA